MIRFLSLLLLLALPLQSPARPLPGAAAVASAHPLATAAGIEILRRGGNAFDAAVAVTATLAVVEPYSSGLGGGGFWLLHRASDGHQVMLDGRETAPAAARRDLYLDERGEVIPGLSIDGPLAAGIPGVPAALAYLAEGWGRMPLHRTLAPAIRAAREGFEVDEHYRRMAQFRLEALRRSPEAASQFLVDGGPPPPGHRIHQPELAETLERIARAGRSGFYEGEVAQRMVAAVRRAGGIWSLEDLREYQVVERRPVTGAYRGMRIVSAAPPSSGGVALVEALNILSGYRLEELEPASRIQRVTEAMRRAYRDRALWLGDPDYVEVPVERLTHPWYADGLRISILPDRATPSDRLAPVDASPVTGNHTTHFSILDRDGNRVAATLSINYPFGSCFVPAGTGVLLNDEMDDFSAKPGVPNVYGLVGGEANAIAPGKRPLSSMSPTFVERPDGGLAILGTPGGSRIISMVLLAILEYAEGAGAERMVSLPRYHHQYLPDALQLEPGAVSAETARRLEAMGYRLDRRDATWGNMQVVVMGSDGRVTAASDRRGGGRGAVDP